VLIDEVKPLIDDQDWARVHFVGNLPHNQFVSLLQVSTVHVYLTYPFVASWSLLEAMSVGCAIVGSDTAPVKEFIEHDKHGLLAPFFDQEALVNSMVRLLDDPELRKKLGQEARKKIQFYYDLQSITLPKLIRWVDSLSHVRS
jgi:glycosyltransferase involved in cell wall biosynthesis